MLKVALLSTSRAPGLDYLLGDDPRRGRIYDLVALVATDPGHRDVAIGRAANVPILVRDINAFYAGRGARRRDMIVRAEFDAETAEALRALGTDLVIACGYLHILTRPMLDAFQDRVINVHDADLTILDSTGRPRYRGLRSTRDAILAGETETRTTVHLVTPEVDVGPVLLRSRAFPVHPLVHDARRWQAIDMLKAYIYAQREWMMRSVWGRLMADAIAMCAESLEQPPEPALVGEPDGPDAPAAEGGRPWTIS